MASIQLISKACTRWRGNLKGLSLERGWTKSAENLGASSLKRQSHEIFYLWFFSSNIFP
jgi:hypothetical protein